MWQPSNTTIVLESLYYLAASLRAISLVSMGVPHQLVIITRCSFSVLVLVKLRCWVNKIEVVTSTRIVHLAISLRVFTSAIVAKTRSYCRLWAAYRLVVSPSRYSRGSASVFSLFCYSFRLSDNFLLHLSLPVYLSIRRLFSSTAVTTTVLWTN